MARATFYTHETSGTCAGACACNRTHQMDKTVLMNNALFSLEALGEFKTKPEQHLRKRNTNSYVVKSEDQTDEKSVRTQDEIKLENCQLCSRHYDLDEWKAFNGMVVAERSKYLVKQKLCYGCYDSISAKHTACNCPKKRARFFYFIFILLR